MKKNEKENIKKRKSSSNQIKRLSLVLAAIISLTCLSGCIDNKKGNSSSSSAPPSSEPVSSQTSSEPSSVLPSSEPEEPTNTMPELDPLTPQAILSEEAQALLGDISSYENEKKGWGQGKQVNDKNRPLTCDQYQPKYEEYGGVFIMPDDEQKIYLTFDEGYENGYTPAILDALKEKSCPAVFFVTMPYVKQNPELIQRMIDEGHVVGNHSVKHLSMPTLTPDEQIEEIAGLHNYMVENFNYQMTLFRPPMGEWSTQSMVIAQKLGYKTVLWSYAYLDYDVNNQMGVDKAFPKVVDAAHNGAVYLLHAVSKDNAEMLSDVIDTFREKGFEMAILQ